MGVTDIPKKFFTRINTSAISGDFSLILDLFIPQAVMQWTLKGPMKFTGPELIVDALKQMTKGHTFVVSEPASTGNVVAVNFDMYAGNSPSPAGRGTATFTVTDRDKISGLTVIPRP